MTANTIRFIRLMARTPSIGLFRAVAYAQLCGMTAEEFVSLVLSNKAPRGLPESFSVGGHHAPLIGR